MKANTKIKAFALRHLKKDKIRKDKKLKGFTLVELIVVIAIIGVLAAILIPTMMGRVKESRLATANDAAAKIAESINIIVSDMENEGLVVDDDTYKAFNVKDYHKDHATATTQDVLTEAIKQDVPSAAGGHWAVEIENNAIVAAVFVGKDARYVGMYPKKAESAQESDVTTADGVAALLDDAKNPADAGGGD